MNGFHPALVAAVAREQQGDMVREAREARRAAALTDTSDNARHRTPVQRPAWWTRVTAPLAFPRPLPHRV
jgi:hypothetical protein